MRVVRCERVWRGEKESQSESITVWRSQSEMLAEEQLPCLSRSRLSTNTTRARCSQLVRAQDCFGWTRGHCSRLPQPSSQLRNVDTSTWVSHLFLANSLLSCSSPLTLNC